MSVIKKLSIVLFTTNALYGCGSFPPFNKAEVVTNASNANIISPVPTVISNSYSEMGGSAKYSADQQYLLVMLPPVSGDYVKLDDKNNSEKSIVRYKAPKPIVNVTITETATRTITIFFKFDSYVLSDEAKDLLKKIGSLDPDVVSVSISGYADGKGKVDNNIILSKNRAEAVVNTLVEAGIDNKVISSNGMGSENAIADNETLGGRSKNRRVEINIIGAEKLIQNDQNTAILNEGTRK